MGTKIRTCGDARIMSSIPLTVPNGDDAVHTSRGVSGATCVFHQAVCACVSQTP